MKTLILATTTLLALTASESFAQRNPFDKAVNRFAQNAVKDFLGQRRGGNPFHKVGHIDRPTFPISHPIVNPPIHHPPKIICPPIHPPIDPPRIICPPIHPPIDPPRIICPPRPPRIICPPVRPPTCIIRPICPPPVVCPPPTCVIRPPVITPPVCVIKPCPPQQTCQIVCKRPCGCLIDEPCTCPVEPGQPAAPAVDLPQVSSGQQIVIEGTQFGVAPGTVVMRIGGMSLQAIVTDWTTNEVTAQLPTLPLTEPANADVVVVNSLGETVNSLGVEFVPGLATAPVAPAVPAVSDRVVVNPGQTISIDGQIGAAPGQVIVAIGGLTMQAEVKDWTASQTTVVLPNLQINEPVDGTIRILTADQSVADEIEVVMSPASNDMSVVSR